MVAKTASIVIGSGPNDTNNKLKTCNITAQELGLILCWPHHCECGGTMNGAPPNKTHPGLH